MSEDAASADRLKSALASYDDSTRQVSTNNRSIAFGLVAITYALLTSDSEIAKRIVTHSAGLVFVVGAIGCLGVVFDYLHYLCAARVADQAISNKTPGHEHQNNVKWSAYIWQTRFYKARTVAALGGAFLLVCLIALSWQSSVGANEGTDGAPSKLSIACSQPKKLGQPMRCEFVPTH